MSVKPITRMEHILAGENITPIGRKEYFVQQAVQNGGDDLPENVKPTYEFGFTVAAGSEAGTFVVTPDSGSTYAAITAALAETPNVLAKVQYGSQTFVALANNLDAEFVSFAILFLGNLGEGAHFYAARLLAAEDGTFDFVLGQIGE